MCICLIFGERMFILDFLVTRKRGKPQIRLVYVVETDEDAELMVRWRQIGLQKGFFILVF